MDSSSREIGTGEAGPFGLRILMVAPLCFCAALDETLGVMVLPERVFAPGWGGVLCGRAYYVVRPGKCALILIAKVSRPF